MKKNAKNKVLENKKPDIQDSQNLKPFEESSPEVSPEPFDIKNQESNPKKRTESKEKGIKSTKPKGKGKKKKKKDKKLPDPEVLRQQFEAWKLTDEYKKWLELSELKKEYPDITETSNDMTGKWQAVEEKIMAFSKFFKVKSKLKELKHEYVRSFFFAREDKENIFVDGVLAGVIKEHSDRAWHLRRKFIEIWKGFDEVHDFDQNNFQSGRKKMAKDITELYKMMVP